MMIWVWSLVGFLKMDAHQEKMIGSILVFFVGYFPNLPTFCMIYICIISVSMYIHDQYYIYI